MSKASDQEHPDPAARDLEADLRRENEQLKDRLREAEETLDAIRSGDVDAVVVGRPGATPTIYTLETADQTYRALVEEMQEGALTLTSEGTVLYCNRRFAELVGSDASRIVGGSVRRFLGSTEGTTFAGLMRTGSGKGEFLLRASDGRSVPVSFALARLNAGTLPMPADTYCCVVTDLTEQKRTEGLLRQSQKMEAVGQLTGGVAHDFNNLLMVLSGGLDMLDRQPDPERRRRVYEGMRQAVQRGAGLTRQLLAFSRRHALHPKPVDLARQIEGMRELLDRSLGGNINVRCEFTDELWPVWVDEGEFELVILNLCVNARDAMPGGGAITIAAHNDLALSDGELAGDFVCVTVADTGTGMSAEVIARAVEPFFTTKDIGKGSGLGLAQAYAFAQGSGGQLRITSELGQGTTISLLLPKSALAPVREESSHSVRADPPPARAPEQACVLLVEDDDEVAALTREMLLELGYEVTRVASAQAALGALADARTINLVFSDVMMPGGMNGLELAREIKRRRADLPIVLTSGYAERVRSEVDAFGVSLLPKPYQLAELASTLYAAVQNPVPNSPA